MLKGNSSKSKCGLRNGDRIVWYNSYGAIISCPDYSLWIYEKLDGFYHKGFEIPTIDEGVRYLKGVEREEGTERNK